MKLIKGCFYLAAVCLLLGATQSQPVRIFLAGDSTMATQQEYRTVTDSATGQKFEETMPMKGWGQMLPDFFNQKDVVILNKALNGRSSLSYRTEGHWDKMIAQVKKGDYVVIEFGHNDESQQKVGRYSTPEDYRKNLERYLDEVQAKGAVPILCTPIARRKFDKRDKFVDTHGVYTDAVREIARERKVLLVDMESASRKLIEEYGVEKSRELFFHIQPGINKIFPNGREDNTHFSEKGARIMAKLFVDGIKALNIRELAEHLKI
ncbi:MAG: rhamnogalacturonan acetylesterase [Tannerella sp.]|jgi:lysophospholipase L1-like esterase|nr:rhamnogalacturonan acetylesterase [Tannerella sp.]